MTKQVEHAIYDILDMGIINLDEIVLRLNDRFGAVNKIAVLELANAYLFHYGMCVN